MSVSNAGAPSETLPSSVVPAGSENVIRWQRPRFGLTFWLCVVWLVVLATTAIGARWLPLADPLETDFLHRRVAPNGDFWLGTDQLGRDTLSRIIFGARVSLSIAIAASLLSAFFGVFFGLPAGYFRGRLEAGVVGATDIVLAFPPIILLLLVAAYGGASLTNLVLVLGFLGIPGYTRIARATTLNFAQRDFVTAARAIGASHFRIMVRELLPNLVAPIFAIVVLSMSRIIVIEGTLSFLGLSLPPPAPTWGNMIAAGVSELAFHPAISFVPAGVMFITILALVVISDALRRASDLRDTAL
ncbi:MAG TPA: ABC transporter permease [Steroidobacteraceae bacterium]|nr:ABC transporter permease [Steroidobacteraceae bacterium]